MRVSLGSVAVVAIISVGACAVASASDSAYENFQAVCLDTSLQVETVAALLEGETGWKEEPLPAEVRELTGDMMVGIRTWTRLLGGELAYIGAGVMQLTPDVSVDMCSLSKAMDGLTLSDVEAQVRAKFESGVTFSAQADPLSSSFVLALEDNLVLITARTHLDTMIELTAMDLPDELLQKMVGTTN
jgi:hypothetical protein